MAKRPQPYSASLGTYKPSLVGLKRDASGIIMQGPEDLLEHDEHLDGGDSAHRTGVLAFCNSDIDRKNLPAFRISRGVMTRHPTQVPWNNPNNCTRDQLIGYIAGCWRTGRTDIVAELLTAHAQRIPPYTCQDIENDKAGPEKKDPPIGDPLAPHDIMYFGICAGDTRAFLDLVSQLSLYIAIATAPTKPEAEINQLLLESIVCGQLDIFIETHANYREALSNYWSGVPWRGQKSIADSLMNVVNIESARYIPVSLLDVLVPQHLLEELRQVNLNEEMKAFIAGNPLQFAQLTTKFLIASLRDIQDHIEMLVRSLDTLDKVGKEVTGAVIVALRSAAADAFSKFSGFVDQAHLDPTGISVNILSIAASVLGFGASGDSAEDKQFREQTTQSLNNITKNTLIAIKAIGDLQSSMEEKFAEMTTLIKREFYDLVLEDLKGEVKNANILLKLNHDGASSPETRARLHAQVDDLRTLIFRAAKYGAGTLGYCFQAYGVVVALLNAAGHGAEELAVTRDELALEPFRSLLESPDGPVFQLGKLKSIEASESKEFNALQVEVLIGLSSSQKFKSVCPTKQDNTDRRRWICEELIEVGLNEWIIDGFFFKVEGEIEQTALISGTLNMRPLGFNAHSIISAEALRAFVPTLQLAKEIIFVENSIPRAPRKFTEDSIKGKATALTSRAVLASQRYLDSRRLQPDLEALTIGVKAAFRI